MTHRTGVIRTDTLDHIRQRSVDCQFSADVFDFEPTWDTSTGVPIPEDIFAIDVFYGGYLDESFYCQTDRVVALVTFVGELLQAESEADADHEHWCVTVDRVPTEDQDIGEKVFRLECTGWPATAVAHKFL